MKFPAIELESICKSFGNVVALDRVNIEATSGGLCAIVGDNGAGKTALVNILTGTLKPDSGLIKIFGRPYQFNSHRDAVKAGIGLVRRRVSLIPSFTLLDNIILGDEPASRGIIDYEGGRESIRFLIDQFSFHLLLDEPAYPLNASQ